MTRKQDDWFSMLVISRGHRFLGSRDPSRRERAARCFARWDVAKRVIKNQIKFVKSPKCSNMSHSFRAQRYREAAAEASRPSERSTWHKRQNIGVKVSSSQPPRHRNICSALFKRDSFRAGLVQRETVRYQQNSFAVVKPNSLHLDVPRGFIIMTFRNS